MSKICIISGRSGVGKNTVVKNLADDHGFTRVVAYTTRERRGGESKYAYHFVSEEEFTYHEDHDVFIDCSVVQGKRYAFSRVGFIKDDGAILVGDGVFKEAKKVKLFFSQTIFFHLYIGSSELINRLVLRDGGEMAFARMAKDTNNVRIVLGQDYEIENKDSVYTASIINDIMRSGYL